MNFKVWIKRLGFWGFMFFLLKGILWLTIPALLALLATEWLRVSSSKFQVQVRKQKRSERCVVSLLQTFRLSSWLGNLKLPCLNLKLGTWNLKLRFVVRWSV